MFELLQHAYILKTSYHSDITKALFPCFMMLKTEKRKKSQQ